MNNHLKPEIQADLFFNASNTGDAAEPNHIGQAASFQCGANIRLSLQIDESHRIVDARFRAAGCSVLVAAASFLTSQIKGETTAESATLAQRPDSVNQQLGPCEPGREACIALACDALLAAITNYSNSIRDEWTGDEALICTCFGVSEETIEQEIHKQSLTTIEDVTRVCNAGAGCRSCCPLIQDILDDNRSYSRTSNE